MQSRKRDTDVENKLMGAKQRGKGEVLEKLWKEKRKTVGPSTNPTRLWFLGQ